MTLSLVFLSLIVYQFLTVFYDTHEKNTRIYFQFSFALLLCISERFMIVGMWNKIEKFEKLTL